MLEQQITITLLI